MFEKLKIKIKELAKEAVLNAEKTLGSNKGKEKKKMAIEFVTNKLPVPVFMKTLVSILLSTFIDEAIELAVEYMEVI